MEGPSPGNGATASITGLWGESPPRGAAADGLSVGEELHADAVSSLRLGAPLRVDLVLGPGARIRRASLRTLEVLEGAVYLDSATSREKTPGSGNEDVVVRAGGPGGPTVATGGQGARFSLELRSSGGGTVSVESGEVRLSTGEGTLSATGPVRSELPASGPLPAPVPADPVDATAWFAYPEVALEVLPADPGPGRDLVVTLQPSVPRTIPIAPYSPFDPLFTLLAVHPERGQAPVRISPTLLRRPPPTEDPGGVFRLAPDRPYHLRIDADALGLPPGKWSVRVLYTANRTGGLWRGTRASNTVELETR